MFDAREYQLLDFGDGRKLERFGPYVLDRPSAAAEGESPKDPSRWKSANARFDRARDASGIWSPPGALAENWTIRHGRIAFSLKPTPFGHLGIFPEQAAIWDWIAEQVRGAPSPPKVLNLFAHTGGSTLAAAAAGAEVVHVDAAANIVAWARQNAQLSGLADAPIRWISEDAVRFVDRELRRDNRYDAVILDPPAYGHGPKGETWKLDRDLEPLLTACAELTKGQRRFMLVTCHSVGYSAARLGRLLSDALDTPSDQPVAARAFMVAAATGGQLPSGVVASWSCD